LGLDHQDENFNTGGLDTCMDYTASPTTDDTTPNAHDFDQLAEIYSHDHTPKSGGSGNGGGGNGRGPNRGADEFFGHTALPDNASPAAGDLFVRQLPDGMTVFTFVTWVQ
jgi:hypothetical protein